MYILKMYSSFPIEIERAKGLHLYTKDGQDYIDTFSGIGVTALGHGYEPLINKLKEKMERYMHLSNFFIDEDMKIVAEEVVRFTGKKGGVFFTNSGTEAVEAALKAIKKDKKNKNLIYFSNSFHGRTLGALSVNGIKKLKDPFLPLLPHTVELPYNDTEAFEEYMKTHGKETGAVFLEPVQGAGGVMPLKEDFARVINKYKKDFNYILVADEIQAGMGISGKIYAYHNFDLDPDIITLGKALGGGLPLGAAIFLEDTAGILASGEHGSTFAPSPVSLAGARFILETIPGLTENVTKKGLYLKNLIESIKNEKISGVRGLGLMLGIVLDKSYPRLRDIAFREENLLLNFVVNNSVIRLLPPLNIEYSEIDLIVEKIKRCLSLL